MIINLILFVLFVLFSAFFSASETALFSLSNVRLRRMQERYSSRAKLVKKMLRKPTHLLSVIVFGNMLVNIGISSLSTDVLVSSLGEEALFIAIFFSGMTILFLGEILPKTLAIYSAEKLSLFCAPILNIFSKTLFLVIFTIEKIVDFFSKFFLVHRQRKNYYEEELKTALLLSRKEGHITADQRLMIRYVLEFKDTRVSEILTARVDIQGIDVSNNQEEVLKILREKHHSKFPVYRDSLDNIVGILYTKDVFLQPEKDYRTILREPIFVPESKKIVDLLKIFLEKNERIAIVLDEYGGTQGLVTLEDIEEEIFGEIYDEFEAPVELITKIAEDTFRVYGKTPIKTVNIELDLNLPEEEDTLAGFLLSQMERIPSPQERFNFSIQNEYGYKKDIEFIIERATAKRIVSVILKIKR
jgi:putative hemolysin